MKKEVEADLAEVNFRWREKATNRHIWKTIIVKKGIDHNLYINSGENKILRELTYEEL